MKLFPYVATLSFGLAGFNFAFVSHQLWQGLHPSASLKANPCEDTTWVPLTVDSTNTLSHALKAPKKPELSDSSIVSRNEALCLDPTSEALSLIPCSEIFHPHLSKPEFRI